MSTPLLILFILIETVVVVGIFSSIINTRSKISAINRRQDLLSKENAKMRLENEELKSKLKNLGFTEIDLKQ